MRNPYQKFEHSVLMHGTKFCVNKKEYLNRVARLVRLMEHITVDELMELVEDIARVRKRDVG